ncbi:MAG: hypothetical protein IPL71_08310 [Anaerolineales bacterium]|uniref:glycosyl hydrolase 2 galactose-binding domain-containing protein n=1 Tax=Candidatus Villigracilis proximus TaxID=3140683 RepID=UPI003134C926|nr:hypothetical protein [Anaerolineales bacterium]
MISIQSLTGKWQFQQAGTNEWLPATVPGGVHTDLLAIGRIPDPFVADNEKRVQWVAESDWVYNTSFSCTDELLSEEKVFLVCDGLDTLATVVLNGHELGRTDNMFRQYQWDVKALLNAKGANELTISFSSPVKYTAEKQAIRPMPGVSRPSLAGRICARLPVSLAGTGAHNFRQLEFGRIFAWKDTARHALQMFICGRIMWMDR